MKILIVAGTFPPYAPSSASRANKFAKFLVDKGHDVRVLAPKLPNQDMSLEPEISEEKIIFTDYYSINDFPNQVKKFVRNIFSSHQSNAEVDTIDKSDVQKNNNMQYKESKISLAYRILTNIPDTYIGWYPSAIKAGRKLFSTWSPDIIFASAPPYTGFVVAKKLAKINNCLWVADYRDLWNDKSHPDFFSYRGRINQFVEKRFLSNCSGLVTVTNRWVAELEKIYNIPVRLAMNGFDPDDFSVDNKNILYPDHLTILYAGDFYGNRRDPMNLFKAMGKLREKTKNIKILFYTANGIKDLSQEHIKTIETYNLQDQIICNNYIPQKELHNILLGVDILLLLRWNDPRENGVIAGKLFEYIGVNKPILSIGSTTGEAASIIKDNDFGIVSNDVDEIANYLDNCLSAKTKKPDQIKQNPNRDKFTRSIQFGKIEEFLMEIVKKSSN